ncbi:hypothetical protein AS888_16915 [Peribacillus simplex]|uniref:Uncharacterized protein n=1 Tax=Peribacillus simplex TaxID=1478 RepID=A0A109N0K0_9BACI|nr:hypothetical protein AS888_16915 [Peribacillus simplex]
MYDFPSNLDYSTLSNQSQIDTIIIFLVKRKWFSKKRDYRYWEYEGYIKQTIKMQRIHDKMCPCIFRVEKAMIHVRIGLLYIYFASQSNHDCWFSGDCDIPVTNIFYNGCEVEDFKKQV